MPKYGIHQIVLSKAIEKLVNSSSARSRTAGQEMNNERGIAMLGAIGPDLFFWAPDYEVVYAGYHMFYQNLEKYLINPYNEVMIPFRRVRDEVGEVTEELVGSLATYGLIKDLVEEIQKTVGQFQTNVRTYLFSGVLSISDFISEIGSLPRLSTEFFEVFKPPLQDQMRTTEGMNEKKWYWFDMLHYRRTGRFAKELVAAAKKGSTAQRAYAFGYMSHIATDVVGHGFVNQIVGAPYRLNVHRHVVVENYMDTWAFKHFYNGASVCKSLLDELGLPSPSDLPDDVVDLIATAFNKAYDDPDKRPEDFFTKSQIKETYELAHEILVIMSKMSVVRPEEPFSGVLDILAEALEDLLEPPPSPPGSPSSSGMCSWEDILSGGLTSRSRECYEEFFEEVERWAEYVGELLLWTLETIVDLIDLILAGLAAMPIAVLLALLYGIQLLLYEFYKTVHSFLALNGFALPEPEDLNISHGTMLTTTALGCGTAFKYPQFRNTTDSHLICPNGPIEREPTAPDFYAISEDVNPDEFIESISFSQPNVAQYAQADEPPQTWAVERGRLQMGNAADMTEWMISSAVDDSSPDQEVIYTNWNLDSDRGYGYKTWTGRFEDGLVTEQYVDVD